MWSDHWVNENNVPSLLPFKSLACLYSSTKCSPQHSGSNWKAQLFSSPYIFILLRLLCCSSWPINIPSGLRFDLKGHNLGENLFIYLHTVYLTLTKGHTPAWTCCLANHSLMFPWTLLLVICWTKAWPTLGGREGGMTCSRTEGDLMPNEKQKGCF